MIRKLFLLGALATAACNDDRPPQPTSAESGQLNEAEDMLNAEAEEPYSGRRSIEPTSTETSER